MSLKIRLTLSVIAMFAIIFCMFAGTTYVAFKQKDDGLVINLAGRQRMLSQKISKEVMLYMLDSSQEHKKLVHKTEQIFSKTLAALTNSGQAPLTLNINGPAASIPKPDATVAVQLRKVDAVWNSYSNMVNKILVGSQQVAPDALSAKSLELLKEMNTAVVMLQKNAENNTRMLVYMQIGFTVLAILCVIAVLVMLRKRISSPLERLKNYALAVAGDNLDAEISGNYEAELLELKNAISDMVNTISQTIAEAVEKGELAEAASRKAEQTLVEVQQKQKEVEELVSSMESGAEEASNISNEVFESLSELAAQVEQVNRGVDVQRDRLTETATAMEEMNSTVLEVAHNASNAAESADQSRKNAQTGAQGVSRAVSSIQQIQTRITGLKETMNTLGQQADSIGHIMDVITDIADQTNLLALNAAIEAARAGEAGRGFAVVADEVRKLAEKTMDATKEVETAISGIQANAKENINAVELAAGDITESTDAASESKKFMDEIVDIVDETAGLIQSIAAASEQQSATSEEINRALGDISTVASETAQGMNTSADALQEISDNVERLNSVVQQLAVSK
ncbi:methyl-accepting chemotaxis protein [Maridesulfovibrio salexigens]|uniref:Methyl-accepting chemotaxis sensory transducer n=1 Tax=Maridesulfovibrio salexigens (strain ATCC 14822 / DSM 2638 / NCIMB 8403 / VKM B-1763) TaxID=526222 RepID=C6BXA9_MARSD|nr:methyl-accepting chemotaxis protein [Maridesulfovibrio salexigens]ACS80415.1 methyl-accepting chemotaxis sensory transducer [Maridesulfovibrio salexigens DSM 2638]